MSENQKGNEDIRRAMDEYSREELERLKHLSASDVKAAREYERVTGESASEWVELTVEEIERRRRLRELAAESAEALNEQPELRPKGWDGLKDQVLENERREWRHSFAGVYHVPDRPPPTQLEGIEVNPGLKEFYEKAVNVPVDCEVVEKVKTRAFGVRKKDFPDMPCEVVETGIHPEDCKCTYCQPEAPIENQELLEKFWADGLVLNGVTEAKVFKKGGEWITDVPNIDLYPAWQRRAIHNRLNMCRPGVRQEVGNTLMDSLTTEEIFGIWESYLRKVSKEAVEAQEQRSEDLSKPLKAVLQVFVNVGQLSPSSAEEEVEQFRRKNWQVFARLPEGVAPVFIAVRNEETRMELLTF